MIPFPELSKIFSPIVDVLVIFIVILAVLNKFITGPILPHKGIESGRLQARDSFYEAAGKPVVDIFIPFFFLQSLLEGLHSAIFSTIEEHVHIQSDAHAASFAGSHIIYISGTAILEYFAISFPVFQRILTIVPGPYIYRRHRVDPHLQAHVERLVRGKVLYRKFSGRPAQVREINGICGRQPEAIAS
jgi:hypothetical protein